MNPVASVTTSALKIVAKSSTQAGWPPNPGLLGRLGISAARVSSAVWCFTEETEEGRGEEEGKNGERGLGREEEEEEGEEEGSGGEARKHFQK